MPDTPDVSAPTNESNHMTNQMTHDDLVLLTGYLAEEGWGGPDIADVVEKPWHFLDELEAARHQQAVNGGYVPGEVQHPARPREL